LETIFIIEDGAVHQIEVPHHHVNADDLLECYDIETYYTSRKDAISALADQLRSSTNNAAYTRKWWRNQRADLPRELHRV